MDVPYIINKLLEKIKEMSGLKDIPIDGITLSIKVNVELDEGQYEELINMLKTMGYSFYNVGYNKGVEGQRSIMEVYHNNSTGEFIAISYMKDEKYMIGVIIYYWDNYEVYA